jgi:hypothetical protein
VTPRLEHEPRTDPVVLIEEMEAALHHGRSSEIGSTLRNDAHGVPARVCVDRLERVSGHILQISPRRG